jgi:hypothetical protein
MPKEVFRKLSLVFAYLAVKIDTVASSLRPLFLFVLLTSMFSNCKKEDLWA